MKWFKKKLKNDEHIDPLEDDYCVVCDIRHNKYTKEMAKVLVCDECTEEIKNDKSDNCPDATENPFS